MSIVMRTDSDSYVHQVWAQEQANSCAVASLWMARNQARQMSINQGEWALAWQVYNQAIQGLALYPAPPAPMTLNPAAFPADQSTFKNTFASFGTYMDQVARALVNDRLRVTLKTPFAPGSMVDASRISDTTPAIVLLGWYSGGTRNGGHFIVASRVTRSGRVVFLDPWQGQLRELGSGPTYPGGGQFEQIVYISAH